MYVFLVSNLLFIMSNLLFFIAYFLGDFTFENILLYYLALIPAGPSLTALCYVMGKLIREGEVSPWSDYWKGYTNSFSITMKYWLIQLSVMFILVVDIYYSTNNFNILSPVFFILLVFSMLIPIYAFPVISRFHVKIKNLLIVSLYAVFRFLKITLLNLTSIISFGVIYYYLPSISTLFIFSLVPFFIMFNLRNPLLLLEEKYSQ